MKVEKIDSPDIQWKYRITLDPGEWQHPLDASDEYLERPIYRWVNDTCWPVSFAYYGQILFGSEADAVLFQMVWG